MPRLMIPVTGSGWIPPEAGFFPALSCRFPRTSCRKKHWKMEAVFLPELYCTWKRDNPVSSLYRILSGSKRDASGKPVGNQRFPSEPGRKSSYHSRISAKKYRFLRDADKIIQYFLDHGKTNKKSFKDLSEPFLILRYFRQWPIMNDSLRYFETFCSDYLSI